MSRKKLPVLLVALLLKAASGMAQSRPPVPPLPPPDPDYQQMSVPVPRAVSLITDVAGILFSRDNEGRDKVEALVERRRQRSEKRDQSINLTIPKNRLTRVLGLVE